MEKDELIAGLNAEGEQLENLFRKAHDTKLAHVGNKVYLRALIEYSNQCVKDCFYCGIRGSNSYVVRYVVSDDEVLEAAKHAYEKGFGSLVLQSGEKKNEGFTSKIESLLKAIMKATRHEMGITLSLGEQDEDTYRCWRDAGAKRYLLRIETSDEELYKKIHPADHSYRERLKSLDLLRKLDYQVGTGVMIGLPFQTTEHLAKDLLFFKSIDIDMVGMGPYLEHAETPLYAHKDILWSKEKRVELSLKMVALLRLLMPNINIAATTALQTLEPFGREKAVDIGANVIMPNLTPFCYRENYFLYDGKTVVKDTFEDNIAELEANLRKVGAEIAYGEHGDSAHYASRKK